MALEAFTRPICNFQRLLLALAGLQMEAPRETFASWRFIDSDAVACKNKGIYHRKRTDPRGLIIYLTLLSAFLNSLLRSRKETSWKISGYRISFSYTQDILFLDPRKTQIEL